MFVLLASIYLIEFVSIASIPFQVTVVGQFVLNPSIAAALAVQSCTHCAESCVRCCWNCVYCRRQAQHHVWSLTLCPRFLTPPYSQQRACLAGGGLPDRGQTLRLCTRNLVAVPASVTIGFHFAVTNFFLPRIFLTQMGYHLDRNCHVCTGASDN